MTNKDSQGDTLHGFVGIGKAIDSQVEMYNFSTINKAEKSNLTEAAQEIQQLLEQISQTYPSQTTSEQMVLAGKAIEEIEKDYVLKEKIISALKAGSLSALQKALNHPAATFVISAVQDWQRNS